MVFSWVVDKSMRMMALIDIIDVITHDKWCDAQDKTEIFRKWNIKSIKNPFSVYIINMAIEI